MARVARKDRGRWEVRSAPPGAKLGCVAAKRVADVCDVLHERFGAKAYEVNDIHET